MPRSIRLKKTWCVYMVRIICYAVRRRAKLAVVLSLHCAQRWAPFDKAHFQSAFIQELYVEPIWNFTEFSVTVPCCKLRHKKFLILSNMREIGKVSKYRRRYFVVDTFAQMFRFLLYHKYFSVKWGMVTTVGSYKRKNHNPF